MEEIASVTANQEVDFQSRPGEGRGQVVLAPLPLVLQLIVFPSLVGDCW
jgi:hypothetical protein